MPSLVTSSVACLGPHMISGGGTTTHVASLSSSCRCFNPTSAVAMLSMLSFCRRIPTVLAVSVAFLHDAAHMLLRCKRLLCRPFFHSSPPVPAAACFIVSAGVGGGAHSGAGGRTTAAFLLPTEQFHVAYGRENLCGTVGPPPAGLFTPHRHPPGPRRRRRPLTPAARLCWLNCAGCCSRE